MPFISSPSSKKYRYLLSGFSNSGKTTSLISFLYGDNDYWSDEGHDAAVSYADGKSMVALACPGEFGVNSLPPNTESFTKHFYEMRPGENINDVKWSMQVLREFDVLTASIIKERPDILAVDGLQNLWAHIMNRTTDGDYLAGRSININAKGDVDPFISARFYSQAHTAFGQYISALYTSTVPVVVCTTLEEWEAGAGEAPTAKAAGYEVKRYLWPALPGLMAKQIVSKFDGRLSARLEQKCLYGKKCPDTAHTDLHHVWQFYPRGDVQGVGIKGLKITKAMKEVPYIHQSYPELQQLIGLTS